MVLSKKYSIPIYDYSATGKENIRQKLASRGTQTFGLNVDVVPITRQESSSTRSDELSCSDETFCLVGIADLTLV